MAEGRTDFERDPNEWYVEPEAATDFLLDRESFFGSVWDPACGMGNIVKTCRRRGIEAFGSDLVERSHVIGQPWWIGQFHFLGMTRVAPPPPNIICNPPYGKAKTAEAFIRKAVALPGIRKAAFFVNAKFLFGVGRARGLFTELPPARVWPVYPRPSCPPGSYIEAGGKPGGGVENFCWIVWEPLGTTGGQTRMGWAPPETSS